MREIIFENGSYYHIYNRGVDKRQTFCDKYDYIRFLESLKYFNSTKNIGSLYQLNYLTRKLKKAAVDKKSDFQLEVGLQGKPLAKIICYCLNPNHFHLLLKQLLENGIAKFMQKMSTGYTKYFNEKYKRSGVLFQGTYKAVEVVSDEQLLYLSAYINGNAEIHRLVKANRWPWSSCLDYIGGRAGTLCKKEEVLNGFENIADYKNYLNEVITNSKLTKEELKDIWVEQEI